MQTLRMRIAEYISDVGEAKSSELREQLAEDPGALTHIICDMVRRGQLKRLGSKRGYRYQQGEHFDAALQPMTCRKIKTVQKQYGDALAFRTPNAGKRNMGDDAYIVRKAQGDYAVELPPGGFRSVFDWAQR